MSGPRGIAILGSTGSIGKSTLAVIALHPGRFRASVLCARSSWRALVQQAIEFKPDVVVLVEPQAADEARAALKNLGSSTRVESGAEVLAAAVAGDNVHMVMAAIVGAAGLMPTLAAARAGKRVLLANKEALVMSGRLLMEAVQKANTELIPIDSEHNAIFQCMPAGYLPGTAARGVNRVILTASGGPFRCTPIADLESVTPDEACNHPKWKMGRKISVDSATLMNKGLEVIEATSAVRVAGVAGQHRGSSAKPGALAGGVRRRLVPGPTRSPGHAHADRPGIGMAGAGEFRCTIAGPGRDRADGFRAARSCALSEHRARTGRRPSRRDRACGAQRGERGRGTGVSRAALELYRDCGGL